MLRNYLKRLARCKGPIAVDLETTGLDYRLDDIVGIGFYGGGSGFHIPVFHKNFPCIDRDVMIRELIPFFATKDLKICMHNANFDRHFLEYAGIPVKNLWMDTQIAFHVADDNSDVALKKIIPQLYGVPATKFKSIFNKRNPIETSDPTLYAKYLWQDVFYTAKLAGDMDKELAAQNLSDYFFKIEMPTLNVIFKMESRGIHIDAARLTAYGERLKTEISAAKKTVFRIVGNPDFNPNSSKQIQKFVFEDLEAPVVRRGKKSKNPSCDAKALDEYAAQDMNIPLKEFASALLDYRGKTKIYSTYIVGILTRIVDGKINPRFRMLTETGRLSSSDPNAQNIPRKSEIRYCFIAPEGWEIIDLDYSQIELRIVAHLSKDPVMVAEYNKENSDIHQATADACGCDRQDAKPINFGLIYRMHYTTLAKLLKISERKAEKYWKGYFKTYRGVQQWQEKMARLGRKNRLTRTILGRPRRLLRIHDSSKWVREHEERKGINHPVQGTAGELIKLAMMDCEKSKILKELKCRLISQVHDELLFRCPKENSKRALAIIKEIMETSLSRRGVTMRVPVIAEGGTGATWGDAKG